MRRSLTASSLFLLTGLTVATFGGCPGGAATDSIEDTQSGETDSVGNVTRDAGGDGAGSSDAGTADDTPVSSDTATQGTGTQQPDGSVVLPPLTLTLADGDVSGDGAVNEQDLEMLIGNYGSPDPAVIGKNDLDRDGDVDITDLALLVRIITELT